MTAVDYRNQQMAYSKLHSSLVNSSLWTEPDDVRLLFITLLAICDAQGYVFGSRIGLERTANIKRREGSNPWQVLLSPDPNSSDLLRNPKNEGRRIEEVAGGFRLLNAEYYTQLRNDDDRRQQLRAAQATFRSKHKSSSVIKRNQASSNVSAVSHSKPILDVDVDVDVEKELIHASTQPSWSKAGGWVGVTEELLKEWREVYPAVDVSRQLKDMEQWLRANPTKAFKSNWRKFATNWLRKRQDRGGDVRSNNGSNGATHKSIEV